MFNQVRVTETAYLVWHGTEVMYLIPPWAPFLMDEHFLDLIRTEPIEEFYAFVADKMNMVMAGKEVEPELQHVVMNLVDDRLSGRKIALRSGDCVALQNAFRETR